MRPRLVITGTGRCGTTWAANVLQRAGLNIGHQYTIRHEHVLTYQWDWDADIDGDASYEAMPVCRRLFLQGHSVLMLVREPAAVVQSWLSLGNFGDDMRERWTDLSKVLDTYCPSVLQQETALERAASFWREWNAIGLMHGIPYARIETLTPEMLCAWAGVWPPHGSFPPVNRRLDHKQRVEVDPAAVYAVPGVAEMAHLFGYGGPA